MQHLSVENLNELSQNPDYAVLYVAKDPEKIW
jgi:hypothetical protein